MNFVKTIELCIMVESTIKVQNQAKAAVDFMEAHKTFLSYVILKGTRL